MSLTIRFLLLVLPSMLAVSLAFLGVLSYNELTYTEAVKREAAEKSAERIALLLREPVWNYNSEQARAILASATDDPDTQCARLVPNNGEALALETGDCAGLEDGAAWFEAGVVYPDYTGEKHIGDVRLAVTVQQKWVNLFRTLGYLGLQTLTLFITVSLVAGLAFRRTVIAPLDRVGDSIRHYRNTGLRLPVNWNTQDELGQLIREYNAGMEQQKAAEQAERESRERAEQALSSLEQAQKSLIQAEKLASLGSLVAGIAHEINTPVGNGLTVATTLVDRTREFEAELASGALRKSSLQAYVEGVDEATRILVSSLQMAADQVHDFKQVAVDQTSSQRRRFNLKQVVEEVVSTLKPQIKHTRHRVDLAIPDGIEMDSFPGPLGQVISNCFNNALIHGFEDKEAGHLQIEASPLPEGQVLLSFIDDGRGMTPEQRARAFDPFFTTRMGQGGSGLGLHLVYNLVTGILAGSVELEASETGGVAVLVRLPLSAPQPTEKNGNHDE